MVRRPDRQHRSRARGWHVAACIVAVLLPGASAGAQERGRCVTVDVPAEYVTPDGVTHAPGSLKLCIELVYSPVSILHKVYVDGHVVGMLQGRTGRSEGPAAGEPYVQFRRNGRGQLLLIGYAWPDGNRMITHILACGAGPRPNARDSRAAQFARTETDQERVLAAARVN
jgi:hypothetical protein